MPKYTETKVPSTQDKQASAEQLHRAPLPLLPPYKNPCHCWPLRVCCHTLTPDWLPAPLRTRQASLIQLMICSDLDVFHAARHTAVYFISKQVEAQVMGISTSGSISADLISLGLCDATGSRPGFSVCSDGCVWIEDIGPVYFQVVSSSDRSLPPAARCALHWVGFHWCVGSSCKESQILCDCYVLNRPRGYWGYEWIIFGALARKLFTSSRGNQVGLLYLNIMDDYLYCETIDTLLSSN